MIHYAKDGVLIRDSTFDDIDRWETNPKTQMRPLEVLEVWASDHLYPKDAVLASVVRSLSAYTIFHEDRLVGQFGIIPDALLSRRAMVWMLTTDEIYQMKISFLKLSKRFIGQLRLSYPVLYNWVDARNEQCVRWLEWVGAEVFPAESYGKDKLPFHYFLIGGQ